MKKIKIMIALVLGLMCTTGMVAPVKAATSETPAPVEVTPRAVQYKVAYIPINGFTVIVHYHANIRGNGEIDEVVITNVSSDSPAGYWGEANIVILSKTPYQWKIRIDAKIRAAGFIQGTNSQKVTINSAPI